MADGLDQAMVLQANSLVGQGKWDEALNLYKQMSGMAPHNALIYQQIAQIAEKKGDPVEAINAYLRWAQLSDSKGEIDNALKLYAQVLSMENADMRAYRGSSASPEKVKEMIAQYRPEISVQMGRIFLQKNQPDEAIRFLKGALDSPAGAQDARVHTLLGIAYMQKNMDKEAIGEFQEVVRLVPNEAAFAYEKLGEIFHRGGKPAQSTVVWFRNAGDLYLRNEQFRDAVRAYEMILQFEPRNKDVLNRLAEIYLKQGMRDQALATYRNLAQIYTEEGLLDKVIILYEKLTELNPDDSSIWDKLVEIWRSILARDPSNLSVRLKLIKYLVMKGENEAAVPEYIQLASAYLEKGILDEAYQVVAKLLEIDARNVKAHELLGDIYMKRDDKDRALEEYLLVVKGYREMGDEQKSFEFSQRLTSMFPSEGEIHHQLARSLKDQGQYQEAMVEIQKVLQQNPQHVPALCDAAEMLVALNHLEEAHQVFMRILELQPDRTDIRMQLLGYYFKTGDLENATTEVNRLSEALKAKGLYREAEMLHRQLLAYYPDNPELRNEIAVLRAAQGDRDRVVQEYLLLANMYVKRKLLEQAAAMYAKVLEHKPDNLNAHYRMGRVLAQRGMKAQALGHFGHLAQEYLRRNLTAQALQILGECVELDPENAELRQSMIELLVRQLRIDEATGHFKLLIRNYLTAANVDEAVRRVKEVVSLQPLNLELRLELATMYLDFNYLEQGQALLEELVNAYLQKQQTGRAIDIYGRMAQIYQTQGRWELYWQVRERLAELYVQENRNNEALAEYEEVVEGALRASQIERAQSLFPTLSELYLKENRVMEGVQRFERVVEVFTRDGNAREAAAAQDFVIKLLERQGDKGRAVDMLRHIADESKRSGDLVIALNTYARMVDLMLTGQDVEGAAQMQFERAAIYLQNRDLDSAMQIFGEIRNFRGDNLSDSNRFAEMLFGSQFYKESLPLFLEVATRDPENVDSRARLAVIYAHSHEMAQAAAIARGLMSRGLLGRIVEDFRVAANVEAGDGAGLIALGAFYEELGFPEEALREYQRAGRISGARIQAFNALAFLFKRFGYNDLAVRQFTRTLEQPGYDDEELLETRYNLAVLYSEMGKYLEALSMFNECSAIKLRYRDVAERIEELTALIASGARADVIPFRGPEELLPEVAHETPATVEPMAAVEEPIAPAAPVGLPEIPMMAPPSWDPNALVSPVAEAPALPPLAGAEALLGTAGVTPTETAPDANTMAYLGQQQFGLPTMPSAPPWEVPAAGGPEVFNAPAMPSATTFEPVVEPEIPVEFASPALTQSTAFEPPVAATEAPMAATESPAAEAYAPTPALPDAPSAEAPSIEAHAPPAEPYSPAPSIEAYASPPVDVAAAAYAPQEAALAPAFPGAPPAASFAPVEAPTAAAFPGAPPAAAYPSSDAAPAPAFPGAPPAAAYVPPAQAFPSAPPAVAYAPPEAPPDQAFPGAPPAAAYAPPEAAPSTEAYLPPPGQTAVTDLPTEAAPSAPPVEAYVSPPTAATATPPVELAPGPPSAAFAAPPTAQLPGAFVPPAAPPAPAVPEVVTPTAPAFPGASTALPTAPVAPGFPAAASAGAPPPAPAAAFPGAPPPAFHGAPLPAFPGAPPPTPAEALPETAPAVPTPAVPTFPGAPAAAPAPTFPGAPAAAPAPAAPTFPGAPAPAPAPAAPAFPGAPAAVPAPAAPTFPGAPAAPPAPAAPTFPGASAPPPAPATPSFPGAPAAPPAAFPGAPAGFAMAPTPAAPAFPGAPAMAPAPAAPAFPGAPTSAAPVAFPSAPPAPIAPAAAPTPAAPAFPGAPPATPSVAFPGAPPVAPSAAFPGAAPVLPPAPPVDSAAAFPAPTVPEAPVERRVTDHAGDDFFLEGPPPEMPQR
jgi:tetratricopeptide (TPR) repeat protein